MIYVLTMAFTEPQIVKRSLTQFKETFGLEEGSYTHILLDQHYPLPDKQENACYLAEMACVFDCLLMRPFKNLGLHEGANFVCQQIGIQDSDILIGLDHDAWPTTKGWGPDLIKVLNDPTIAIASLWNKHAQDAPGRVWQPTTVQDVNCLEADQFAVNGISAFPGWFIRSSGGFSEPCAFYGHIEQAMWTKARAIDRRQVYLAQHFDDLARSAGHDARYGEYKHAHAHSMEFRGSFEEWLKSKGHI